MKRYRILFTLIALSLAIGAVMLLTYIGKKSKGPLTDLILHAGEAVQKVEQIIIRQGDEKRINKLHWYKAYKTDSILIRNPNHILFGAFDNKNKNSYEGTLQLEDTLKTTFPLLHIYTAWGSKPEQQFPELQVKTILELGSTPVITWEPWLSDFVAENFPTPLRKAEFRDAGGLRDIARGKYDSYIKTWAQAAAQINQPIFLRVGHEMNDPYRYPWGPQNNSAKDFILAWKHIHSIFRLQGATKVIWIWSPHPAYGFFEAYYPGKKFVDYIGVGILNYGTVANWSKWWSFKDIFGKHYKELAQFNKPIMITEFGCLKVGGNRNQWFSEALRDLPQKYPLVKSIVYFHFSDDNTTTQQALNWYFLNDKATIHSIIKETSAWKN